MSARGGRLRGARGTANALIIIAFTGVMLVAAGLAHDGGRVLAARREAVDVADQAARAGVQAVDAGAVRWRRRTASFVPPAIRDRWPGAAIASG